MMPASEDNQDVRDVLKGKPRQAPLKSSDYLSTGSTLLNLACTGKPRQGFMKGHYYFLVGDSSSGKTFLSLTCFAEACASKHFDEYELIFDNAENGALMDWARYFGSKAAARIKAPSVKGQPPSPSVTIQDFYDRLDALRKRGKPSIYVLDSMDALSSVQEEKTISKQRASRNKGDDKKTPGSYGDGKAKENSGNLRRVMPYLHSTGSILIIIGQTRDSFQSFGWGDQKTRSGGHALTFYATLEMWSSIAGRIKKRVGEKDRPIGVYSKIRVKKNRIIGRDRTVIVPIYDSVGIDDIGGCIDYLVEEGHWPRVKGIISAKEFDLNLPREKLVKHIEDNDMHRELQAVVAQVWEEIETACRITRKSRYE